MTRSRLRPVLVAAVVCTAVALGGCTTARNALGPAESPCFRALPVASAAVNGRGHFSGVRYLTAPELAGALATTQRYAKTHHFKIPALLAHYTGAVCAVAYTGQFVASRVANGWPPAGGGGTFAIVVVRVPNVLVLTTIVTRRPPLRLTKLFPALI